MAAVRSLSDTEKVLNGSRSWFSHHRYENVSCSKLGCKDVGYFVRSGAKRVFLLVIADQEEFPELDAEESLRSLAGMR